MKYVAVDKEYKVKTENHGDVKLPVNFFEVAQYDTLDEIIVALNGAEKVVEYLNGSFQQDALNNAKAVVRNAPEDADMDETLAKAQASARDYTPSLDRNAGKATLLKGVENIKQIAAAQSLDNLSKDDLLALIRNNLKI
jgi:hypothetical protein